MVTVTERFLGLTVRNLYSVTKGQQASRSGTNACLITSYQPELTLPPRWLFWAFLACLDALAFGYNGLNGGAGRGGECGSSGVGAAGEKVEGR
jgi:hypothetical protein